MNSVWHVGIDIGGTFTDVVAVDITSDRVRTAKVPSRPDDPVASVDSACEAVGLVWDDISDLMHGTTMATNAIVEDKLAPVALIATTGFRDVLEIGRQNRAELYRLDVAPKLPPLVPADRRLEVDERVDAQGRVVLPLSDEEADRVAGEVAALPVEAVAVSLQNSYANWDHERRLGERLEGALPHVALSHRMNPEPREYERTNATVLNAALMPLTAGYLARLQDQAGGRTNLHLFHSAGGMASVEAVKDHPLALALSGPAAGVAAARRVAEEQGLEAVIGFDMGGTTTDASVVLDAKVQIGSNQRIAGRPVRQLMVAVESIGAGGGSIARTEGKAIRVGPDSAGAEPGPACYGLGGAEPTVTDANLVLGYLGTERLLGGTVRLDADRARRALGPIAEAFAVGIEEAALGIHRIANASMARALRRVTVERGVDARTCALLAFGGAGPMHAVALAAEFGISKVVVPHFSSVFSALGCLTADFSYGEQHAARMSSERWDVVRLETLANEMRERLSRPLLAAGLREDNLVTRHVALIRYAGQSDTVEVPFEFPVTPARLGADFKARHERLYGFATDERWELDTLRISVSAATDREIAACAVSGASHASEPVAETVCWFDESGPLPTPRYERGGLDAGERIAGPAIVEDEWSTVVVSPGSTGWTDAKGHLHIDVAEAP